MRTDRPAAPPANDNDHPTLLTQLAAVRTKLTTTANPFAARELATEAMVLVESILLEHERRLVQAGH